MLNSVAKIGAEKGEIPEIGVGSSADLSFVSKDIPENIFDKYGTNSANLKLAITPEDGIGWKEVKGNENYNFLDELGIGQFEKPVPEKITDLTADAIEVAFGETAMLLPVVTPAEAADTAEFAYSTEDKDIISVSNDGEVKGLKEGSATVTITCGGVSTDVAVTVTSGKSSIIGDVNMDGVVTISDATAIQKFCIGIDPNCDFNNLLADVNNDGVISVLDATCVQRFVAEMTKKTGNAGKLYSEIVPASVDPGIID